MILSDPRCTIKLLIPDFQLWLYKEGIPIYIGLGHGAVITAVRVSPDGRTIISASADGAIFIWRSPTDPECRADSARNVTSEKSVKSLPPSRTKLVFTTSYSLFPQ